MAFLCDDMIAGGVFICGRRFLYAGGVFLYAGGKNAAPTKFLCLSYGGRQECRPYYIVRANT
jgi:hypothetical protein